MRGARSGCVATLGAAGSAVTRRPSSEAARESSLAVRVADQERAARELPAGRLERLLRGLEGRVREPVAQRRQAPGRRCG